MGLILKTNSTMVANSLGNIRDLLTSNEIISQYIDRVEEDGGTINNLSLLTNIANFLAENKLAGKVRNFASASLGYKVDGSGNLVKLYDLFGNDFYPNYFSYSNGAYTDNGDVPVNSARQLKYMAGSALERPYILMNSSVTESYAQASGGVLKEGKKQKIGLSTSLYCAAALYNESSRPTTTLSGFIEDAVTPTNPVLSIQLVPGTSTDQLFLRAYDIRNDTATLTGQYSTLELTKSIDGNTAMSGFGNKKLIAGRLDISKSTLTLKGNQSLLKEYGSYSKASRTIPSITAKATKNLHLTVPGLTGGSYPFGNIKVYDIVVMRDIDDQTYESMLEHLVSIVTS